jgi:phage shock protein PspC (stress-responsive transcriptional regulator)/predicted membrane protein
MGHSIGDMDQNPNGPGGVDAPRFRDVQTWRRSRSDRMIAGVCGGVGRALNIDPVLIRVVMAVLTIAGGAGIPIYIAAWLLMPEEGTDKTAVQDVFGHRARPNHPWLWPVVIGLGIFCAVGISSSLDVWPFSFPGPLIAIFFIWFLISRRKHNRGGQRQWHGNWQGTGQQWPGPNGPTGPVGPPAGTTAAPPTGSPYPASPASSVPQRPQDRPQDTTVTSGAAAPGPVWTEDDPLGLYVDDEPAAPPAVTATRPVRVRRNPWVKPVVMAAAGLAIGIAFLAGATVPMALAIGLLTLGAGMMVGAYAGRTRGLLFVALPLAIAVAATSTFSEVPEFGDKRFAPVGAITATNAVYEVGVGSLEIDLTKATFSPGAKVSAHGDAAEVKLILPPNVDVTGTASAELGELNVFGQRQEGHKTTMTISDLGQDLKASPQSVTLDISLRLGSIVVERG